MIGDDGVAVGSLVLVVLAPGLFLIAALRANWLSRLDRPLDGGRTLIAASIISRKTGPDRWDASTNKYPN